MDNKCVCKETEYEWTDERNKIEWLCKTCGVYLSPRELNSLTEGGDARYE